MYTIIRSNKALFINILSDYESKFIDFLKEIRSLKMHIQILIEGILLDL